MSLVHQTSRQGTYAAVHHSGYLCALNFLLFLSGESRKRENGMRRTPHPTLLLFFYLLLLNSTQRTATPTPFFIIKVEFVLSR